MNDTRPRTDRLGLVALLAIAVVTLALPGCGGGSDGPNCGVNPTAAGCPPTPVPPAPAASITGAGAGSLVLHPSRDTRFTFAMATPIRITETAGGSADWGFARIQFFNRGVQVERTELTANDIRAAGYGRITASSNQVYNVVFRFNSQEFDQIDITLGFSDVKDARQFTVPIAGGTFSSVDLNFDPLSLEHSRTEL